MIRPLGVLELQRADKRTIQDHSKNCAPCHLPNLNPTIITSTWIPPLDYPCQECQRTNDVDQMLLCDNCNGGYHLFYLKPEFIWVPAGNWYCSSCSPTTPWFLLRPCHVFPDSGLGGIHKDFILASFCALYVCVCVCVTLYNTTRYDIYHARTWPHTWWPVTGMPMCAFSVNVGLRWLYVIRYLGFKFVDNYIKGQTLSFSF